MSDPSNLDAFRREMLLSDLRAWDESFWKNEGAGESRIKFYVTLVTAVGAGLSALYQASLESETGSSSALPLFQQLVPIALAGLLLFGLVTFARMVRRNQVTDEYKEWAHEIRRHLLDEQLYERIYGLKREPPGRRDLWNGGLTSMMLVMNAVVAGVFAGYLLLPTGPALAWINGMVGFLFACWGQGLFLEWRHQACVTKFNERATLRASHAR